MNTEWDVDFLKAIEWVEGYFNKKYTEQQTQALADLLRHDIPSKRLMKVAQFAVKEPGRKRLLLANDFLEANKLCPYSRESTAKTYNCQCSKGLIFCLILLCL